MWQLAAAFAEIAMRRRGPETLPDSKFLVAALLVIAVLIGVGDLAMRNRFSSANFAYLFLDAVLWLAYVFAVLSFFKLERRYLQTLAATLGAQLIIYLVYLPAALGVMLVGFDLIDSPPGRILSWLLVLWTAFVAAWILARALSQPLIVGLMFEILYILTSLSIGDLLLPDVDPATEASGAMESTA